MARETFERELQQLKEQVLVLGSMVEQAVIDAVTALRQLDRKAARRIQAGDQAINEKRYEIEHNCLTLIATQQPMARDLRFLAAILEIITELERIGDYAKGIAHITLLLDDDKKNIDMPRGDLKRMAELGLDMLRRSLDAFITLDAEAARAIPPEDDAVDELYNRIYHKLLKQMLADPDTIETANRLTWAAHNLERLADRVTNICERIVFVAKGQIMELDHGGDESKPER